MSSTKSPIGRFERIIPIPEHVLSSDTSIFNSIGAIRNRFLMYWRSVSPFNDLLSSPFSCRKQNGQESKRQKNTGLRTLPQYHMLLNRTKGCLCSCCRPPDCTPTHYSILFNTAASPLTRVKPEVVHDFEEVRTSRNFCVLYSL